MFNVIFSIKLNNKNRELLFGSPKKFIEYDDAKTEANILLNKHMTKLFREIEANEFVDVPEEYDSWFIDRPNELIVSILDGIFDGGEFYIAITKDKIFN